MFVFQVNRESIERRRNYKRGVETKCVLQAATWGPLHTHSSSPHLLSLPMSNGRVCRKQREKTAALVGELCFSRSSDSGMGRERRARKITKWTPPKTEKQAGEKQAKQFFSFGCFTLNFHTPDPGRFIFIEASASPHRGCFRAVERRLIYPPTENRELSIIKSSSHRSRLTSLNNEPFCRKSAYRFFLLRQFCQPSSALFSFTNYSSDFLPSSLATHETVFFCLLSTFHFIEITINQQSTTTKGGGTNNFQITDCLVSTKA